MRRERFVAETSVRADLFLSEKTGLSRSAVKKLADAGHVFADGIPVRAGDTVKAGRTAEIEIPDPVPVSVKPEDLPIDIVYEDDALAVVNKPRGMTVHIGNGNREGTLVNALLFRLGKLSGINGELRPGIVHRIDKDTTGLLVVAKNDSAYLSLSAQIAEKSAHRTYLALLEGVVREDGGRIVTQMGRDPKDRLRQCVLPSGQGRRAETEFSVVRRFSQYTLVRFTLQTGRTHQIRVHAKYMGHPVVGDKLYGFKKQRFSLEGQLLHAYRLEFTHPVSGERVAFEAPLPEDFARVLRILEEEE